MKEHERKQYLDLLRKYDNYNCFEFPKDFDRYDRSQLEDRKSFTLAFEKLTNLSFKFTPVQDASHYGSLVNKDANHSFFISLRFSSFGRLVALTTRYSSEDRRFFADFQRLPFTENEIANLLGQHNFRYVPLDVLYLPYDGVNTNLKNLYDYYWWNRYFDYI